MKYLVVIEHNPSLTIWFSTPHARANCTSARRFNGCGLACRARQANVLGWWHST